MSNDKIVELKAPEETNVAYVLRKALEQGYEGVVVFGFKGSTIYTQAAWPERGRIPMLGALEAAKMEIWNG